MAFKAKFQISNPDDVVCDMTISLTLFEWKYLKSQLKSGFPAWKLNEAIAELVDKASEKFEMAGENENQDEE